MADSKTHHFVPQSILRNFAFKKNKINVYDKKTKRSYPDSITSSAGAENNYNSINYNGEKNNLEYIYNNFDGMLAAVTQKIIKSENLQFLNNDEIEFIKYAFVIQILRSPIVRSSYQEIEKDLIDIIENTNIEYSLEPRIDKNEAKIISIDALLNDTNKLFNCIKDRSLILLRTKNNFIISDNPITMFSRSKHENISLTSIYTEINFPISTTLSLTLLPEFIIKKISKKNDSTFSQIYNCLKNRVPFDISKEYFEFLNSLQVTRSKRFIYSKIQCNDYIEKFNSLGEIRTHIRPDIINKNNRIGKGKILIINHEDKYIEIDLDSYELQNLDTVVSVKFKDIDKIIINEMIPKISIYVNQIETIFSRNVIIEPLMDNTFIIKSVKMGF